MNRPSPHTVKVFLCGKELDEHETQKHFDKRIVIKRFLNTRMGCKSFLGEDIEDVKKPTKIDVDALTIEVSEAKVSDVILIFLESLGTTAELTAFVTDPNTVDKVYVFNDKRYKNSTKPSFVSIGPLKLLEAKHPGRVIYYEPESLENGISPEVLAHLDSVVSRTWFNKSVEFNRLPSHWTYERFVTLASLYALYPVTLDELEDFLLFRLSKKQVEESISSLRQDKLLHRRKKSFFEPAKQLTSIDISRDFVDDISRCRSSQLHARLKELDFENRYRLIL